MDLDRVHTRIEAHITNPAVGDTSDLPMIWDFTNSFEDSLLEGISDSKMGLSATTIHLSRNVNISSPSETTASFTTHQHLALASLLPRDLVSSA